MALLAVILGILPLVSAMFPALQAVSVVCAVAATFAPHTVVVWLLATIILLLAARGRAKLLGLAAAVGLICQGSFLWPYAAGALSAAGERPEPTLTVMEANLWYGQADPIVLAGQVEERAPQILVLTEVTETAAVRMTEELAGVLPYHLGDPGPDGSVIGTMVFSKYPLTQVPVEFLSLGAVAAEVAADDGRFTIIAVHPANPLADLEGWLNEGQSLTTMVNRRIAGPLVVAGDLNATNENLLMRRVLAAGMHDAAVEAGAGWVPTYPANDLPPVVSIDHVLMNKSFRTSSFETFEIVGSDHRGVVAELARIPG